MRKAVYHFRAYDFNGGYIPHATNVEIVGESDKSYKVKFLQCGPNNRPPGTTTWVKKQHVKPINN